MTGDKCRLVLASASPQRRQILAQAGYTFEAVDPGETEEAVCGAVRPEELAQSKARAKAQHVAATLAAPYPALVVGCDTLVVSGERIIGKPLDRNEAVSILSSLSGTRHRVISGLCLWPALAARGRGPEARVGAATTWVRMRPMRDEEIAAYVASGESDGKAGGYAVQEGGDRFVESLEGSFLNVVGFPLELFEEWLPRAGREWGLRPGRRGT